MFCQRKKRTSAEVGKPDTFTTKKMDNQFCLLNDDDDDDDDEDSTAGYAGEDIGIAAMIQIVAATPPSATAKGEEEEPEENTFIENGDEEPVFFTQKAYIFNQKFSLNCNAFFGRCYLCCYPGHSQRYCSLKYCVHCDKYGHSALQCPEYPKIQIPFR